MRGNKGHQIERRDVHVIVDLDFGEESNAIGLETEGEITAVIAGGALNALKVFDAGKDDIDAATEEMIHVLTAEVAFDGGVLLRSNAEAGNGFLESDGGGAHAGDGLKHHTGRVKVGRVRGGAFHHRMYRHPLHPGKAIWRDGSFEQR